MAHIWLWLTWHEWLHYAVGKLQMVSFEEAWDHWHWALGLDGGGKTGPDGLLRAAIWVDTVLLEQGD